jgi:anti-sigma factor RsiW
VAKEKNLHNTITTKKSTQRWHSGLSRGSVKYKTCLLHVVASQRTRVALNSSQVIQWSTWIPRCFWEHLEGGGWIGDPVKLKLIATKTWLIVSTVNAKWLDRGSCTQRQSQEFQYREDTVIYPVVRPSTKTCLLHVVVSQRTRVALNSSQVIQWSTWIPQCYAFLLNIPFARNLHNFGASRPYTWDSERNTE